MELVGQNEDVNQYIVVCCTFIIITLLGSYKFVYNSFFNVLNSSLGKSLGDVTCQLIQGGYFTFSGSYWGRNVAGDLDLMSGDSLEDQGYDVAEEVYTEEERDVPQLRAQEVIGEIKLSGFFER